MNDLLKKIVNLGIGATSSIDEKIKINLENAQKVIDDMIDKGKGSDDGTSAKIHQFLDDVFSALDQYSDRASNLIASLKDAINEIDPLNNKKFDDLNQKIDELQQKLKN